MEDFLVFGKLDMQTYTKLTAGFLALLGIGFYILTNFESPTALIPTFLAVPLAAMAILTEKIPERKSLFMHIAVVLGVICAAGGGMAIKSIMAGDWGSSTIEQLIMLLTGVEYTAISVFSFIHARKQREA